MIHSTALRSSWLLLGVALLAMPLGCGDEGDTIFVIQSGGTAGGGGEGVSGRTGSGGNSATGGSVVAGGSGNGGTSGASGGTNGASGGASGSGGTNEGGAGASGAASGGSNGGTAGSATGGGANGGTGGTGSGTCTGTPTACATLNESQCDNQEGCTYVATCEGVTLDCVELDDLGEIWCNEEPNCTWNVDLQTCQGETPPTCYERNREECLTLGSGCYLDGGCFGDADECQSFLLAGPCEMQLGCTWQPEP
jgi:hypothetical protein